MSKRHRQSNSHLDITCVDVIKIVKGPSEFPFESFINAWSLPRSCALMIFVAALTSVLCGRAATARAALSARAPFNAVHTSVPRSFDAVLGAPNAVENDLNLRSELACSFFLSFRGRVSPARPFQPFDVAQEEVAGWITPSVLVGAQFYVKK